MQIAKDTVVALAYELHDADGKLIDANHPLAGKTLHFTCTVMSVRAATHEEIGHGHVHGAHGHHH